MKKLLNKSLWQFILYAGLVLAVSIPVYYFAINELWQYEMDEHNIILTPEADREDKFLIIGAVTLLTVIFFALLLGVLIWVNRRISRRIWQPFYTSLAKIKDFDLSRHKDISFGKTNIAEFTELNESLDKLISGNIAAYTQQKEFAENASHELQTPLSVIQSKLDLLLQSKTLKDEHYSVIEEAFKALSRVSRINKNLLLLTKIENSQYMEKEQIDLSSLINADIPTFSHFSEDKQLSLTTNITPEIVVQGNKILVEILVQNLFTNAIRHSPVAGTLSVYLDNNKLEFTNTGDSALKGDQLFKRFASASSYTPGTGLGLSLVKQICHRYGWQISYDYSNGQHIFSVKF